MNLNRIDSSRHSTPRPYTRLQKQEDTFIDDIAKILDEFDEGWSGEFEDPRMWWAEVRAGRKPTT
jgi:hypothetical protein